MHREAGGSGSVCDVGELGWRGRKGAVLVYGGISGDLHPTPPPQPRSSHPPSLQGPRKRRLTASLM